MNKVHRNRLEKLADYLHNEVTPKKFVMDHYCHGPKGFAEIDQIAGRISQCGTSACAMGYAVVIFPYVRRKLEAGDDFDEFAQECFGLDSMALSWSFLFSGRWSKKQNTPKQAAKRIRLFLDKGLPKKWNYSTPVNKWVWESL